MSKNSTRVRIVFKVDEQLKSFYWFECNEEDIYWGYSGSATKMLSTAFNGKSLTINLEECKTEHFKSAKASYHQSGEFHIKLMSNDGLSKYDAVMKWRQKQGIKDPFRIMALFSKAPALYDDYNRSPTRKGSKVQIFQFNCESQRSRKYIEFFISPEGKFARPKPLVAFSSELTDVPITLSLSNKYILAIRILSLPIEHELNNWNPDKEICFYTIDNDV